MYSEFWFSIRYFVYFPLIEKFNTMIELVEETEVLQNGNTNKEPANGKTRTSSTHGNSAALFGGSSIFEGQFSKIFVSVPSFVLPALTTLTGSLQSLPACFDGSGDFEGYRGQFKKAAYLSGSYRPSSLEPRP